jgi:hypothetical protein
MGEIVIGQTNKKIGSGKLQRALRNNMSDAEQVLAPAAEGHGLCPWMNAPRR